MDRRHVLGLTAGCAAGAALTACSSPGASRPPAPSTSPRPTSAPKADGALGVDVDQNLADTRLSEMADLRTSWWRGFYVMQDAARGDVAHQDGMRTVLDVAGKGYGTVLNLKFNHKKGLPSGGDALRAEYRRLDAVLDAVLGKVDILAIGNEPYLECGPRDAADGTLNRFYEAMAHHVIDRRKRAGAVEKTQLYMGALTDLENPAARTPSTSRWLEFAKRTPELAGTDCHPHVPSLQAGRAYLDCIVPRLRTDQRLLATEFSLVKRYRKHLTDPVPPAFATRHRLPHGTQVWQYTRDAIARPVPEQEWNDFLLACPWFADSRTFMTDLVTMFRTSRRLAVAAYPLAQGVPMTRNFGPKKAPWVFTSMFCPHTVRGGSNGLPGRNRTWTGEFRALQGG